MCSFVNDDLFTSDPLSNDLVLPAQEQPRTMNKGWHTGLVQSINKPNFRGTFGLKVDKNINSITDAINLIFTDTFFIFLTNQINKRIVRTNSVTISITQSIGSPLKVREVIKPVVTAEVKKFLGLNLYFGILKLPNIKNYWTNDIAAYGSLFVKKNMTYARFTEANKHFSLSSMHKGTDEEKRDVNIANEKIITYLTQLFSNVYSPNQELSIDEGMCKYQGRYSFKTYMPSKPTKIGMKFYILTDSVTGYVINFKLYTGQSSSIKNTVLGLLGDHVNLNHTLYMDNFYNSYDLCYILREKKVYVAGTMRGNRGEPEEFVINKKQMKKGDYFYASKDKINILMWYDKKVVCFISTFMNFDQRILEGTPKLTEKPEMIRDYDRNMGGVDKYDQMLRSYYNERKNKKWTNKFAIYLLNMMVHNSYIIYQKFNTNTNSTMTHLDFRKNVVKMFTDQIDVTDQPNQKPKQVLEPTGHWPNEVDSKNKRNCKMCWRKGVRKTTRVFCEQCKVFLCIKVCFKHYHTEHPESESSGDKISFLN